MKNIYVLLSIALLVSCNKENEEIEKTKDLTPFEIIAGNYKGSSTVEIDSTTNISKTVNTSLTIIAYDPELLVNEKGYFGNIGIICNNVRKEENTIKFDFKPQTNLWNDLFLTFHYIDCSAEYDIKTKKLSIVTRRTCLKWNVQYITKDIVYKQDK